MWGILTKMSDISYLVKSANILLISDGRADSLDYSELLIKERFKVTSAFDSNIVLNELHNKKVDLLLIDCDDSIKTQVKLLKRIRSHNEYRDIPIIIICESIEDQMLKGVFNLGSHIDYIIKPVVNEELLFRINTQIEGYRSQVAVQVQKEQVERLLEKAVLNLRRSEAYSDSLLKFRMVLEEMPVLVDALDEKGRIVFWNQACVSVTGYSQQEMINNPNSFEILYPDEAYRNDLFKTFEKNPNLREYELVLTTKKGKERIISWTNISSFAPIPGWSTWAVGIDVTERRKAEAILFESKKALELSNKKIERAYEDVEKHKDLLQKRFDKKTVELQKSQVIIDTSTETIINTDLEGKIIYWNSAAQNLYGYTSKEAIGKHVSMLYKEQDLPKLESMISNLMAGEDIRNVELTCLDKNKDEKTILMSLTSIKDGKGEVSELVGFSKDISKRKKIQNDLNRLNLLFEDTSQTAKVGGWEIDLENDNITLTQQTYDIYELPYGQLPSIEEGISYYHPDHRQKVSDAVNNAIAHNIPYDLEVKLITAKNNEIWVHTKGNPIVKDGKVVRLYGSIQDITENKNIQLELKKSQEIASLGSWYLDYKTGNITWSEELYKMYGFDPDKPIPPLEEHAKFLESESWKLLNSCIDKTAKTGEPYSIELKTIKNKGSWQWMYAQGEAILNGNDDIVGLRGIAQDITNQKLTELALRQSEKRFTNMASNLVGAIFQYVLHSDGTDAVMYMSPSCYDLWEVDAETVVKDAKILWDMVHPDDLKPMYESVLKSARNLDPWDFQWRITTPSGKQKWLEAAGRPEKMENGDTMWDSLILDVTRRKVAETDLKIEKEKVERSEKMLKEALEQVTELKNKYQKENIYLKEEIDLAYNYQDLIYVSNEISDVLNQVDMVAGTNATVLLHGETGTGKEIIARAIHSNSLKSKNPLIKVNCAAIPQELIESELFGHKKGSFTGAINNRIGKFELANGGTIFLDEIGELPIEMQPKLLRVLQEGEIEPVGGSQTVKVDVRVIAATNRNLLDEIEKGNFREDLFFRLNVFPINIPPLRERQNDIPVLINHFVSKFSSKYRKEIKHILKEDLESMINYDWPGNVRELENLIERSIIVSKGDNISFNLGTNPPNGFQRRELKSIGRTLDDVQREHIFRTLKSANWKITGTDGAAKILDLKPSTLRDRMKKLNISKPN